MSSIFRNDMVTSFTKHVGAFCRLLILLGFILLRYAFTKFQDALWKLNGTSRRIEDSTNEDRYDSCVHVLDVLLTFRLDMMMNISMKDFICMHNRFENPKYIFEHEHVTLLTFDENYAIFAEARRPGMHLWKTEYSAFMKLAQLEHCDRLLLVPLDHFHRMSEERGNPSAGIVFLFSTGRCGSTLLTQMVERTNECVSISEHDAFLVLWMWYLRNVKPAKLLELSRDVVRWICRPYRNMDVKTYFLKVTPTCIALLPIMHDVFSRAKYLFMYRNVSDVTRSFSRAIQVLPLIVIMNFLGRYSRTLRQKFAAASGMPKNGNTNDQFWDDTSLGVACFARSSRIYLELRRSGFPISAVRYEDLVRDPITCMRKIFDYCGLPETLVPRTLDGMSTDAHRNSPLSTEILKKIRFPEFSLESRNFINEILSNFGLPEMEEECLLEGTITCKR